MTIQLKYGKKGLPLTLPDHINVDVIEPRYTESLKNEAEGITDAIRNPYSRKPLNKSVVSEDIVGIVFSDITRATPYEVILPPLLEELSHLPDQNIRFFGANGTHRLCTDTELISILGEEVFQRFTIVQNDISKPESFRMAGKTATGNPIFLNSALLHCDLKILTGFIEPHFFAGYSGGGKAVMPGMASLETIRNNHSITNLSNKKARWGITKGNPIVEEVIQAAELAGDLFLLNITMNKDKKITNVFAGDLRRAHESGCAFVKESAMVPVPAPYDIVVTTNSGFPLDLNVYQSVKGMSAAAQIVKEGGIIIAASECWDGIPANSDYEKILSSVESAKELKAYIMQNESTLKDTWQVFFQALIQEKADVYLYSDKLDDSTILKTLFKPTRDIEKLINGIVKNNGSDTRVCVLPEGPQTIPYLKIA